TSGAYLFTLRAIDECGEEVIDTAIINVTINSAPSLVMGTDFSRHLCVPEPICVGYAASDPDGPAGLVEALYSGYGTINTTTDEVCFTPTTAGSYEIVVGVTDPCGAFAADTIVVTVTFGEFAEIDCPSEAIDVSLCDVETVCQGLDITPASATVTTSYGTYTGGELCFLADTSGTYVIEVIAAADCGADTCEVTFNVDIGQAAQIDCPAPSSEFLCEAGSVCFPIGIMGTDVTVTVSPIGSYTRGNVCFTADTTGHYEITVIADTPCGSDTCTAVIDVTLNLSPVAVDLTPVDTFICAADQVCVQFEATDPESAPLTWHRITGNGTVTADGLWCFNASANGTYTVTASVTDTCGASDQITASYTVTINKAPIVSLGNDTTVFVCASEEMCFTYAISDLDDNITLEELLTSDPTATINTVTKTICFTPSDSGLYGFIVRATDACGAVDEDTIGITVNFNRAPTLTLEDDFVDFQCTPSAVCPSVSANDPDNNLVSLTEVTGVTTSGCFTPDTSGVYTLIYQAEDACGLIVADTITITITLNTAPTCNLPPDTAFFQCAPGQVSMLVSANDIDGNFDHCEIVSGPGSIVAGRWVYTPSTDQAVKVVIMCLDSCGANCIDSFNVAFDINAAPVADAGVDTTFFLCGAQTVCWDGGCTDEDDNLATCEVLSPVGATISGGTICLPVNPGKAVDDTYRVVVRATDACGATDVDTAFIGIDYNAPPVVTVPPDFVAYLDAVGELCFSVGVTDPDDNLDDVFVSPLGVYNAGLGKVCFQADTTGEYCFEIRAVDDCGAETIDSVCIDLQIDACMHVQIEKTHDAIQGQHELVNIFLNGAGHEVGGFDFLLGYDASALNVSAVLEGDIYDACGWEYFQYRHGIDGNCNNLCPTGLLRIVGIAETNNGAYHPGCYLDGMTGTFATVDFMVSNDRTLECQFVPISFLWVNCGDNAMSSRDGDTLWVSRHVYNFEFGEITDDTYGFPGYYGAPNSCLEGSFPDKPVPIRCVDFTNGGIDIVCADSIDARGDINLNGIANEIADAVMFTNYFVIGLSAFGEHVEGSIAASEANGDGLPLTVADLVYLIRVVVGDAAPIPKYDPTIALEADMVRTGNILKIEQTPIPVGAIFAVIEGEAKPTLAADAIGMELRYHFDGTDTRVLIFSEEGTMALDSGAVLDVNGPNPIRSIEVGSSSGLVITANIATLPDHFGLSQ
ncbi:MAG: hypothetical protein KKA42_10505, partial [candidate division Zixibacteria bacterium]|nr:hypothetical protein [candidate division Zixibacteria bacterium]